MYEDHDRGHPPVSGGNGLSQLLRLLALGALLGASVRCVWHTHRRRHGAKVAPLPERLQTWEGEGGRPEPVGAGRADARPAQAGGR